MKKVIDSSFVLFWKSVITYECVTVRLGYLFLGE